MTVREIIDRLTSPELVEVCIWGIDDSGAILQDVEDRIPVTYDPDNMPAVGDYEVLYIDICYDGEPVLILTV